LFGEYHRGGRAGDFLLASNNKDYYIVIVFMLTFVESPTFTRQINELLTDAEYAAFQQELAANPVAGDVIPGLGGLRKIRMAAKGKGKRGGARVIYPADGRTGAHLSLLRLYKRRDWRT
jgi:mRNA-degrading endonuclease RelE of RelBE toxin-antitoxin system